MTPLFLPQLELPYNDYFEYFGPDFKLHISPSNMTNQNTNEYLEKIKWVYLQTPLDWTSELWFVPHWSPATFSPIGHRQRLFENLRMLPHAPGVQMQAIPEDAIPEESGDEEEDDPDKRISSKIQILGTSDLPLAFLHLCSAPFFFVILWETQVL